MKSILHEAIECTSGARRRDYDSAEPNHQRIAGAWNWYLNARKNPSAPISALDAAHMMALLKIARACFTPTRDTYVDLAGYSRCAAEIAGFEVNDGVVPSDLYEEGD
jgi:hypothetical protein